MGDVSANFSRSEFRDHRNQTLIGPDQDLVVVVERIRALSGRPLRILSGYRSPSTNRAVGGSRRSQHLRGTAADIPAGVATLEQALAAGARGVGIRDGWAIHIDVRRVAHPVVWRY